MIAFGAQETGMLLGASPFRQMAGLDNFTDTRMSFLSCYVSLKENINTLYMPENHFGFVKDLAHNINVPRTVLRSNAVGSGKSEYIVTVNQVTQMANLKVQHIGADFHSAISAEMAKIEPLKLAYTLLNLPVSQEAASLAFSQLEDMGFFWGAWLPNYSTQGDVLRLQKLHESVNVDEIICAREQGENIKKYIISEWQRVSLNK
jgi:hypothetical protein